MTVVAATLAGLSVSAANVSWNVDLYDISGSADTTAYTLYVFSDGGTASSLASALNTGGKFDESAYNSALSSAGKVSGVFDGDGWAEGSLDGITGTSVSFLILTDGTTADSTFYYAANVDASPYLYTPPAGASESLYVDYASFTSGTVGTGVPEPTSGLLLLVGAGMLALRRKRA